MEIEAGQQQAIGVLSASADAVAAAEESDKAVMVKATATVGVADREAVPPAVPSPHERRWHPGLCAGGDQ